MKKENDYPLIPMSEITDEARELAVAWMECDDRSWIGQKHKLASDIMNYARRYHEAELKKINKYDFEKMKSFKAGDIVTDVDLFQRNYPRSGMWRDIIVIENYPDDYIVFRYRRPSHTDESMDAATMPLYLYYFDGKLLMVKP